MARLLVFTTSAAVLVLEILAGRLLAPYLGVSLEVFTGIIGVVLAGISIGAWLGGRAADRREPSSLLGPLLVGGGLAALAAPLIIDFVGPIARGGPVSIVALTAVGFFLPAAMLSAVPPVVVKARLASLDETGSVVGSYSAIGTAGAIFGTFATGFILIAAFPTRPIMLGLGIVLVLGGALLWGGRRLARVAVVLVAIGLGAAMAVGDGPCDYETTYHCAIVQADPARPTGRLLILDQGHNSYVDLEDPTHLEFRYLEAMSDVVDAEAPQGPIDVVSIGGGGFTFPRYLAATRPGTSHLVLEIDRELLDIGRRDLGFEDEAEVVIDDARRSLTRGGSRIAGPRGRGCFQWAVGALASHHLGVHRADRPAFAPRWHLRGERHRLLRGTICPLCNRFPPRSVRPRRGDRAGPVLRGHGWRKLRARRVGEPPGRIRDRAGDRLPHRLRGDRDRRGPRPLRCRGPAAA